VRWCRGPGTDPLELPEQGMDPDRHPRHPGPRASARRHARAGRRGRGDRDPGGPRPVAGRSSGWESLAAAS
jgi:hypothetical protein